MDDKEVLQVQNYTNDKEFITYTKESRVNRKKEIEIKTTYHRKNPKSIEYYKNQKNTTITTPIDNNTFLEKDMTEIAIKTINHKKKNKGQFFMMFKTLDKLLKSQRIFLKHENNFDKINVYKDTTVFVNVYGENTNLDIRYEVGVWKEFSQSIKENPTNFTILKNKFLSWLNSTLNNKSIDDEIQLEIDKLFAPHINHPHYKNHLHKLKNDILKLNKPSKQMKGFKNKIQNTYFYWHLEASEINHIEEIEKNLNLDSYENSFPLARQMRRKFSIFIGPTNSGKTYQAMQELSKFKSGLYLAPLRLMAAEGQESLFELGIITNLVTGEEQKIIEEATHVSSTIEMCNFSKVVDVAVIDEIQMIADKERGWAWSQALIGVPANHVVLVGSEESLPYILPVLDLMEEEYEIRNFERKAPLTYREPISRLDDLKAGDCVVVFSRKNALEMKYQIEQTNKKCSIIYGNLSPEVRRHEAAKFKNGETHILIATDAIGMGLNLPINRLFFSTMKKFDGEKDRCLTISEVKQIAGRSGRYGITQTGEVGLLGHMEQDSISLLKSALESHYPKEKDTRISISPNMQQVKTICNVIQKKDVYSALIFFKEKLIKNHNIYKTAKLDSMLSVAGILQNKNLDIDMAFTYSCVPIDTQNDSNLKYFFSWVNNHIHGNINKATSFNKVNVVNIDSQTLFELENYVKLCMGYRWLHYKYPDFYPDLEKTIKNISQVNYLIEQALEKQNLIKKKRRYTY